MNEAKPPGDDKRRYRVSSMNSLPGSEHSTPHRKSHKSQNEPLKGIKRSNSIHKMQASDFAEKIKQLEIEGSQLRDQVEDILHEVNNPQPPEFDYHKENNKHSTVTNTKFSHLTDIRDEEKSLNTMKSQLDDHGRDVHTVQQRFSSYSPYLSNHPFSSPYKANVNYGAGDTRPMMHYSPSTMIHSLPPSNPLIHNRAAEEQFLTPALMEKDLKEARKNVDYLQHQLRMVHETNLREVTDLSQTIEDLKARLYETKTNLDTVTQKHNTESKDHEKIINRLKESVEQLLAANRKQEQTLLETNGRLDQSQQNHYLLDSAIESIRSLLTSAEQRRGSSYHENDPVSGQSATMLAHTLDRCLREYQNEIDMRGYKIRQYEQDLEECRKNYAKEREEVERESNRRISNERDRADRDIRAVQDEMDACRRHIDSLYSQLQLSKESHERERREKDELERKITAKLNDLDSQFKIEKKEWCDKVNALEKNLDSCQKELAMAVADRETAGRQRAEMESKLHITESKLLALEETYESEQRSNDENLDRANQLEDEVRRLENELRISNNSLNQIENALISVQDESMQMIRQTTDESINKIQSLQQQHSQALQQVSAREQEVNILRSELISCQEHLAKTNTDLNMMRIEMDGLLEEKNHMSGIVGNRSAEVERLTTERDYYYQMLDEKTEELANLKVEKQRLMIQIREKLDTLKRMNIESYLEERASQNMKREYEQRQEKVTGLLEETRLSKELLAKKLKSKEKQIRELESAINRMKDELREIKSERTELQKSRENLTKELKECRKEIQSLCLERHNKLNRLGNNLEKKVSDLTGKLNFCEPNENLQSVEKTLEMARNDLKYATENLRLKEASEKRAVKSGMVVDPEYRRLQIMEDEIASLEKERDRLREENTRLCHLIQKMTEQNEKLSEEFEFYLSKNQELRDRLAHSKHDRENLMTKVSMMQHHIDQLQVQVHGSKANKPPDRSNSMDCIPDSYKYNINNNYSTQSPTHFMRSSSPLRDSAAKCGASCHDIRNLGREVSGVLNEMRELVDLPDRSSPNRSGYGKSCVVSNYDSTRPTTNLTQSPVHMVRAPREQTIGSGRHGKFYSQFAQAANNQDFISSTADPSKDNYKASHYPVNNSAISTSLYAADQKGTNNIPPDSTQITLPANRSVEKNNNALTPSENGPAVISNGTTNDNTTPKEESPRSNDSMTEVDRHLSDASPPTHRKSTPRATDTNGGGYSLMNKDVSGRSSPVEELLMTPAQSARGVSTEANLLLETYESMSNPKSQNLYSARSGVTASPTQEEADEMCRILEEKIGSLNKLGGDFQKESRDTMPEKHPRKPARK